MYAGHGRKAKIILLGSHHLELSEMVSNNARASSVASEVSNLVDDTRKQYKLYKGVTRQQTPLLKRNITKDEEITRIGLCLVVVCRKELDFATYLMQPTAREAYFEKIRLISISTVIHESSYGINSTSDCLIIEANQRTRR